EAEEIFNKNGEAYLHIFHRLGLKAIPMQADNGAIGGTFSCEFQILADSGESKVYYEKNCYNEFCELCKKSDLTWGELKRIADGKTWAWTEEKYSEEEVKKSWF
ncbi:MAG: hypothetical protein IJ590_01950, partial [Rickettsiales bacterium]|nr:hypothetical protein [Rickettsiales bacterium]